MPLQNLSKKPLADFPHLKRLHLAHHLTSTEQFVISLLIGTDHYWDVVEDHIIKGNGPTAMGSKLGYLLSGPMGTTTLENTTANILHVATMPIPDPVLQRFWSVESLGIVPKDDTANTFLKHVKRLPDGSYSARFPWKVTHPALPTNFSKCACRTRSLTRKLGNTPPLLSKYHEILKRARASWIHRASRALFQYYKVPLYIFDIMLSRRTLKLPQFVLFMIVVAISPQRPANFK